MIDLTGFKTTKGAMVGGTLGDMQRVYGQVGGLWRGLLLDTLDRKLMPGVLLMDGIFVGAQARGQGLGTRLLRSIKQETARRTLTSVRPDLIDVNLRPCHLFARRL